jgi:hypothetical protein
MNLQCARGRVRAKSLLLALCLPILALGLQGCSKQIDAAQAQSVNGLVYKLHDSDPFSGTVKGLPLYAVLPLSLQEIASTGIDGTCEREFKGGKPHGTTICVAPNGTKIVEQAWKDGGKHGVERTWTAAGVLWSEEHWKDGKQDGLYERYNPEIKKLITQVEYKDGQPEGKQKAWDVRTGETLLIDLVWHNGKETGTKKFDGIEETFLNGRLHGARRAYTIDQAKQDAVLQDMHLAQKFKGGAYFIGMDPAARLTSEWTYVNGTQTGYKEFPKPGSAKPSTEGCQDKWIAARRKEAGADAVITSDQLDEWEQWCKEGKQPS